MVSRLLYTWINLFNEYRVYYITAADNSTSCTLEDQVRGCLYAISRKRFCFPFRGNTG